jgi:hypothetical protein
MASVVNHRPLPTGISTPSSPRPPIKGEHHPEFHRTSPRFFSPLSTPEQRSHQAPTPPNLRRRRPASTLLLHLGSGPRSNPDEPLVLSERSRRAFVDRSARRQNSGELLRSATEARPRWTGVPVVHGPWTQLTGFSVRK